MAPEYEKLRELYNGPSPKRTDILITRIQGNSNEQSCNDFGVYSYPTILLFKKSDKRIASVFQSPFRIMDVLSEWIEKNVDPPEKNEAEEKKKKEEEEKRKEDGKKKVEEEGKKKVEEDGKKKEEEEERIKKAEEEPQKSKEEGRREEEEGGGKREEDGRRTYELLVTLAEEMKILNKTVVTGFEDLRERREQPAQILSKTAVQGYFPIIIAFTFGVTIGMLLIMIKNMVKRKVGNGPTHHLDFKAV